jgi:hypothetical protein
VTQVEVVWVLARAYSAPREDIAAVIEAQCEYTATFDTKAAKSAGLKLIK